MAIKAYIDDSGIDQPPVYCLGGYAAQEEIWAAFAKEWTEELSKEPKIAYFKYSEAYSGEGEFSRVDSVFRKYKVLEMGKIISKYADSGSIMFFGCIMFEAEWKKIPESYIGNQDFRAYETMYSNLLLHLSDYYHFRGYKKQIDIKFDTQPGMEERVKALWRDFIDSIAELTVNLIGPDPDFFR